MKRLGKKLHSERGASLVMALLLLLLVCMMVAASVLAAASSNAGKHRSNRVEQQKFLTLSSALRLVCDELERAEYKGKYTVYEWEETIDGPNPGDPSTTKYYFYVEQTEGEYSCDQITDQLPLGAWLDKILSEEFEAKGAGYKKLSTVPDSAASAECTLTVTLPDSLGGYPYADSAPGLPAYQVPKTVTVRVNLDRGTQNISLRARLGDSSAPPTDSGFYTMEAELVAVWPGITDSLDLVYDPGGRTPAPSPPTGETGTNTEIPIRWTLNRMKKEVP